MIRIASSLAVLIARDQRRAAIGAVPRRSQARPDPEQARLGLHEERDSSRRPSRRFSPPSKSIRRSKCRATASAAPTSRSSSSSPRPAPSPAAATSTSRRSAASSRTAGSAALPAGSHHRDRRDDPPGPVRTADAAAAGSVAAAAGTAAARSRNTSRAATASRSNQPVPAWVSLSLGSAYFRSGKLADAEREYKAAIDADGRSGEALNNLAVVYLETERFASRSARCRPQRRRGSR